MLNLQTFHVLAADVDDIAHIGFKRGGSAFVRERFDFTECGAERRAGEVCAVSGGTGLPNVCFGGHDTEERLYGTIEAFERLPFILFVPAVEKTPLSIEHDALDGG